MKTVATLREAAKRLQAGKPVHRSGSSINSLMEIKKIIPNFLAPDFSSGITIMNYIACFSRLGEYYELRIILTLAMHLN
ncbi:MAG: hypothetical protein RMY28_026435 [Nostoc sp. ChiSLP01]|nr:hypothetical protein [Nostoc sp. CmiSLP01]MDZ8283880.1 hypothetical protein [Nostoc sp. ChiSLP01]